MVRPSLVIIIPALNEAATIGRVVSELAGIGSVVVVVDDGSSDRTEELSRMAGAHVIRHEARQGYDRALQSGTAFALSLDAQVLMTMDADGQHDPKSVATFLDALADGATLAVGVRSQKQRFSERLFAFYTRTQWGLLDPLCGMKAYRMDFIRSVGHFDSYNSIGTELLIRAAKSGEKITQIAVPTHARIDPPRFGSIVTANFKILRALVLGALILAD